MNTFAFNEGFERYEDYKKGLCTNLDNPYCMEDERYAQFQNGMEEAALKGS